MDVAITTTTANRSHVEALNGFVSMRTSMRLDTEIRMCGTVGYVPGSVSPYGDRAPSRSTFTPGSVPRPMPTVPTAKRAHWRQPPDRPFPDPQTRATQSAATARAAQAKQHTPTFDTRHGEACPSLLGKDPALMLRADTTAPVVNDEEKLARATTQVHKVAREGYRFDVGRFAIWAGCDRATTLVAGAQHVGTHPARNVPAQPQAIRAKLRGVGAGCKAEVVGSDPFRQLWGITHGPARGQGATFWTEPNSRPLPRHSRVAAGWKFVGGVGSRSLEAGSGTASRCRATFWTKDAQQKRRGERSSSHRRRVAGEGRKAAAGGPARDATCVRSPEPDGRSRPVWRQLGFDRALTRRPGSPNADPRHQGV